MELWYPLAHQDPLLNAGNFLTISPWRGVLHTTEGTSYAGAKASYIKNKSAPHFTIQYTINTDRFDVWQHIPLDKAARALKNLPGGVETNRLQCIQIEIVWTAANAALVPEKYLKGLRDLMIWIEANTGIKPIKPSKPFATQYGQTARRMTNSEWLWFNGWCGHSHVPENDHWDPGNINIDYLLTRTTPPPNMIIGPPMEVDVQLVPVQLNISLDSNGKGWVRVPYSIDKVVGLKPHSGTRPGVDGAYDGIPDVAGITPDDRPNDPGSIIVVQGGNLGGSAPVWFHLAQ